MGKKLSGLGRLIAVMTMAASTLAWAAPAARADTVATSQSSTSACEKPPVVTGASPDAGPAGPMGHGPTVTISGSGFSNATAVYFGTGPASPIFPIDDDHLQVIAPQGIGVADIRVQTALGMSPISSDDKYTYMAAPTVTSISPNHGPALGGTPVTVTGTGFERVSAVIFGPGNAAQFTVDSDTKIVATSPPLGMSEHVQVTTPGGMSMTNSQDVFTPVTPPLVQGVVPNSGPAAGGTSVHITGYGFTGATSVDFGSAAAPSYSVTDDRDITATTPPGVGNLPVIVSTVGGPNSPNQLFQYTGGTDSTPTITSVSPDLGPMTGRATTTIMGSGFLSATALYFGNEYVMPISYRIHSDDEIDVSSTPPGIGTARVSVVNSSGRSPATPDDQYTFLPAPSILGIAPPQGPSSGGTDVTITGTGLSHATQVLFGAAQATDIKVVSDTEVTVDSPSNPPGTAGVQIVTPGGTTPVGGAPIFTYIAQPRIDGLNPPVGTCAGGNSVQVIGQSLGTTTAVYFGTARATNLVVNNDGMVTVTAPSGVGRLDVTVVAIGGTSATSPGDAYNYQG